MRPASGPSEAGTAKLRTARLIIAIIVSRIFRLRIIRELRLLYPTDLAEGREYAAYIGQTMRSSVIYFDSRGYSCCSREWPFLVVSYKRDCQVGAFVVLDLARDGQQPFTMTGLQ
jgi:hypothetical protein